MKIAVCLFGHLRTYEKCCKALRKNLMNGFDCDVFMHTWSTFDHNTQTWHKWKMKRAAASVVGKADKIKKAYGLSSLKIEEQQAADFGRINANGVSFSIAGLRYMAQSMTESVCSAVGDYDYIVVCRPDLLLKTPFDIPAFIKGLSADQIDSSFFVTANLAKSSRMNDSLQWLGTDLLFFGRPAVVREVLRQFKRRVDSLTDEESFPFPPEHFLIEAAVSVGKSIVLSDYVYGRDFEIRRPNSRKNIVSLRIRKNKACLRLFAGILPGIFQVNVALFNKFTIELYVGGDAMT